MSHLTNLANLKQLLNKHQIVAQKTRGQHFLVDGSVLNQITTAAQLTSANTIIEIGPGPGVLTHELIAPKARVIAIEIDPTFQPILEELAIQHHNFTYHIADARKINLPQFFTQQAITNYKIVANLPYNAGSHLLDQFIKSTNPPQQITVLLQEEVVNKITAQPPHSTYLSNFIANYGQAHTVCIVPATSFSPPPAVSSAVITINKNNSFRVEPIRFSAFLHKGFANPRKMINKVFDSVQLQAANIDSQLRPENLTLEQWITLYHNSTS